MILLIYTHPYYFLSYRFISLATARFFVLWHAHIRPGCDSFIANTTTWTHLRLASRRGSLLAKVQYSNLTATRKDVDVSSVLWEDLSMDRWKPYLKRVGALPPNLFSLTGRHSAIYTIHVARFFPFHFILPLTYDRVKMKEPAVNFSWWLTASLRHHFLLGDESKQRTWPGATALDDETR